MVSVGDMPHPLVDIGVNLAHRSFDTDRDEVVARAKGQSVQLIITGTDLPRSPPTA
jgi:TatD DNase family protein